MKNLTLIIVCALFCISASVVSKNVFTPAKPDKFFIKSYVGDIDAIEECKKLHREGWQTIKVNRSFDGAWVSTIVTAEKY